MGSSTPCPPQVQTRSGPDRPPQSPPHGAGPAAPGPPATTAHSRVLNSHLSPQRPACSAPASLWNLPERHAAQLQSLPHAPHPPWPTPHPQSHCWALTSVSLNPQAACCHVAAAAFAATEAPLLSLSPSSWACSAPAWPAGLSLPTLSGPVCSTDPPRVPWMLRGDTL